MWKGFSWNISDFSSALYSKVFSPVLYEWNLLGKITLLTDYYVLQLLEFSPYLIITSPISNSLATVIKFISLIALLIFVRGGVPRYRYDFFNKNRMN